MAATVSTVEFVLSSARDAYSTLRRTKGQRPMAVKSFLDASTDDERDQAIESWGAGFIRRGLREAAIFFTAKGDEETANAFWMLRDSIDDDGFTDMDDVVADDDDDIDPDVLQEAMNALSEGADEDEVADFIVSNS